jgi:hypothetical protein
MMKTIPFPEEARRIAVDFSTPRWTPAHEVQCLCWLVQQTQGTIVEIGCNEGRTTRDLAVANPTRSVLAVDYAGADDTLCPEQKGEKPHADRIGRVAAALPNVLIVHTKSSDLPEVNRPIGFVFIDGDHSYRGVKADTELALERVRTSATNPCGGIIAWHDCYDEGPAWVGVRRFLEAEMGRYPIVRIEGTCLAMLDLRNPGGACPRSP